MRSPNIQALLSIVGVAAISACVTARSGGEPKPTATPPVEPRVVAAAFSPDRATLWYVTCASVCEVRALAMESRESRVAFSLTGSPDALRVLADGSLLFTGNGSDTWRTTEGAEIIAGRAIVAAADAANYAWRDGDRIVWQHGGATTVVGQAGEIAHPRLLGKSTSMIFVRRDASGERLVRLTPEKAADLTAPFKSIDSFDIAPREDQLAFSARREGNYDIGIVSTDGGRINWVPPDPADEVMVTWAPRGNKITYAIRGVDATFVRSVHIPTSFQLTFELPYTSLGGIAWESRAERIALICESPASSSRIDWVEYSGSGSQSLVAPAHRLTAAVERTSWDGGSGVVLPPAVVRYEQKQPIVVTLVRRNEFKWRPAVAALQSEGLAGALVVDATAWKGEPTLERIAAALVWADPARMFVIDPEGIADRNTAFAKIGATLLQGGKKQGGNRPYMERASGRGVVITIPDATPAEFEARAVAIIRERLQDGK